MQTSREQHSSTPFPRVTLEIFDLSCGSDALRLEHDLAALPGVRRAYVNPATEMAYLEYDPAQASLETVIAAVRHSGFHAALPRGH